jgi:hypothetical protein
VTTPVSGFTPERERLLAQAARHRTERSLAVDTDNGANWQCGRGHAWDAALSDAQNVRCMGCASQRRELLIERQHAIASERGGRLLSPAQADESIPLRWECAYGHRWDANPRLAARRWCTECAKKGMYEPASELR